MGASVAGGSAYLSPGEAASAVARVHAQDVIGTAGTIGASGIEGLLLAWGIDGDPGVRLPHDRDIQCAVDSSITLVDNARLRREADVATDAGGVCWRCIGVQRKGAPVVAASAEQRPPDHREAEEGTSVSHEGS